MIDFDLIRKDPALYANAIKVKRIPLDLKELLELDIEKRQLQHHVDELRRQRNEFTELVATGGDERDFHVAQSKAVGNKLKIAEAQLKELDVKFKTLLALVPGIPAAGVPVGETDADNVEVMRWREKPCFEFEPRDHLEIAQMHKMADFGGARDIAGSRAYALKGMGALLEIAILNFALQHVVKKGCTPVIPPLLVNERAMFGTGYFPLGEDSAYHIPKDNLYLTGTSEVGTVAIHANTVFSESELPQHFAGISACFRREAGAAGRDTKGLYRVHQFQKVEQVVFCPNDVEISAAEHLKLLSNAEEILQALELPYRVVAVCTGDMGLGQVRKHDIETWMPSRNAYGETHSCSTFYDFQARRLNIKYRTENGEIKFIHTLNNTAIASPRILIPFLENHQNKDGTINVPPALRPFLNGVEILEPDSKTS